MHADGYDHMHSLVTFAIRRRFTNSKGRYDAHREERSIASRQNIYEEIVQAYNCLTTRMYPHM